MDNKDLTEFIEELDGFCGEVCFRRTYKRENEADFGVTYTAFPMYEEKVLALLAETCEHPEGREEPCVHDIVTGLDRKNEMLVVELFAESIWGRSHAGSGTVHRVFFAECERTMLVDPRHLPEGLQESIHRNLTGSTTDPCPACDGTGTKDPARWVTVEIPKL